MASGREVIKKAPAEGLIRAGKSEIPDFYPKYRTFHIGQKKSRHVDGIGFYVIYFRRGAEVVRRSPF